MNKRQQIHRVKNSIIKKCKEIYPEYNFFLPHVKKGRWVIHTARPRGEAPVLRLPVSSILKKQISFA